ncbi:hypothetical protein [Kribbella sp. NPDC023855]|uniref:hypothetical protein n=1 Tax=Kribbella sp. NPDC023855 TaxID=3154698 RepID=UPI0034026F80
MSASRFAGGLATLIFGLGATAACSPDQVATPVEPSPGPLTTSTAGTPSIVSPPAAEGAGLTAPGIRLVAIPRSDGSLDITEHVVLRSEVALIRLQLPRSGRRLAGMMRATKPVATGLKIIAGDQPVPLSFTQLSAPRDVPLTVTATRLQLTYRLTGSTVRSRPSESGRAAVAINPLTAGIDGTLPTNYLIPGGGLRNAVCPALAETRCAVGEPPGLGVQQGIPAGQALAVLQLNLPK